MRIELDAELNTKRAHANAELLEQIADDLVGSEPVVVEAVRRRLDA